MTTIKQELDQVEQQLEEVVLKKFTNEDACDMGVWLYQKAKEEEKSITISIIKSGQRVFYASLDGTSKENDDWIRRKENTANHFCKSSYEVKLKMMLVEDDIWNRVGLSKRDYAQHGGSVPIRIEGVGMIGTITVSGMKDFEDHDYAVQALKEWKKREK